MTYSGLLCVAAYLTVSLSALAGDMGCSLGPTLVGWVAGALGDARNAGILCAAVFPVLMLVGLLLCSRNLRFKVQ